MDTHEQAKLRRRQRDKLARERMTDGYVRKLVKERMQRLGLAFSSEEIPGELLEAKRLVLAIRRIAWDRPIDVQVLEELTRRRNNSEQKTSDPSLIE